VVGPRQGDAVLPARERRILETICDALVPPPLTGVAPSPGEMADFVESFVRELPATSALGFRAGLWTLAGAARLRGRPLDAEELRRLESSKLAPLRLSARVVCGLGLMALYSAPSVREKLELP
jgi:hypothetical protein